MSFDLGGSDELGLLAQAIGLVDGGGELDVGWFSAPLTRLQGIVRNADQRAALGRFCDLALVPIQQPGRPAAEKWHPLLGDLPSGNLYLTLNDTGSSLLLGVGGEFHSSTSPVPGRLRIQADILSGGSTLDLVIGTAAHPITAEVRIETAFTPPAQPIKLAAIVARCSIVPDPANPSFGLEVVLEGLSINGEPPTDKVLDVDELGREAPDLLAALLKVVLAEVGPDPTLTMLADHLLGLFGLADGGSIPAFPFAELADGPAAVQNWLATLPAGEWLEHLAGLLGATSVFDGTGTLVDPWRISLLDLAGLGELYATVARSGDPAADGFARFGFGVNVSTDLGPNQPTVSADASCVIADVPLSGTGNARVLPEARALLRLTGASNTPLVDNPQVRVGTVEAGIGWDGSTLKPVLQLLNNQLAGTPYPVLDLTNVDSVEAAAANAVVAAINAALGTDVGRRLAAIAGLVPPEDPANPGNPVAAWPHQLDLAKLVVDPARAIETYHRAVLGDADRWNLILREIAQVISLPDNVAGEGTTAEPWTVDIAIADGATLQLAAWHQPHPDTPTTEQLRIGLRLAAEPAGSTLALTSEVLAFDLPATGSATVSFIGAQRLSLVLSPALDAAAGPIAISLDDLTLAAGWQPGQPFGWDIHAHGLTLTADGETITLADVHLPPAAPFDLTNLPATAATLGLTVTDLENVLRLLLSMLAGIAGPQADLATALLGLHHRLPGLDAEIPSLVDPAQPGLLFQDPLGAVRSWLGRLITHVGADGELSAALLLQYLASLGTDAFDELAGGLSTDLDPQLPSFLIGGGTFGDPWRVPWPGGTKDADGDDIGPDLELWLEPAGPPIDWLTGMRNRVEAATDLAGLAEVFVQLAWFDPAISSLVKGLTVRDIAAQLRSLQVQLNAGDGVVPRDAQSPDIFGWVQGAEVDAAHLELPRHPDAIAAVLNQIETLHGAGPRTVLLVGPVFGNAGSWADLLAAPALQGPTDPNAHFDLRTAGIDPRTIALDSVTAVADYYTADLADDRRGDVRYLADQIAHIADRLEVLHPGPVIVVAHSYAGLAARRFAADHPTRAQGVITIGTPHLGTPLAFLDDPAVGDAIRLATSVRAGLQTSPLRDALDHLKQGLEGYEPPVAPGALATPDPYPASSFTLAAPYDLGDVPVMTIAGVCSDDFFTFMQTGMSAYLQQLSGQARPTPSHLSYGMAMPMSIGNPPAGSPQAEARVRFGLGQIPLGDAPPPAPRPAQLLRVELDLFRSGGWIVGQAGPSAVDGRLRRLLLGLTATGSGTGIQATLDATLDQAAWRGTTIPTADLTDPRTASLIGAAFDAALASTDSASLPVSTLAAALGALDLVSTDAQGITGLSGDGFAALRTDPVGYLRARIPAALARPDGWAGLVTDLSFIPVSTQELAYVWAPPGSPYALFVRRQADGTWRTGIETGTALGAVEPPLISISTDIDLLLPAFQPTAELVVHVGPVALTYRTVDGTIRLDAAPFVTDLTLLPTPSIGDLAAKLDAALPQILVSGVVGNVLAELVPGLKIGQLLQLLQTPGEFLAGALGALDGGLDPAKLSGLLATLNTAIGLPTGLGLQLPADVTVTAGPGAAPQSARIAIGTTTPIGGVLAVGLTLDIDATRHVAPGGTVTISTPLSGTWPQVAITFGVGPDGVTLVVTPQGVPPITLLPTFSGLGALRGAAGALLPTVLDEALTNFPEPRDPWLVHTLQAATHLGVYDAVGHFSAHTAEFTAMLEGTWFTSIDATRRAGIAAAVADLLNLIPTLELQSVNGLVRWTHDVAAGTGRLQISAGWSDNGPTVAVALVDLKPADAPLALAANVLVDDTGVTVGSSIGLDLSDLGVTVVPRFAIEVDSGPPLSFRVRFLPLSSGTLDGPLVVQLAPDFALTTSPAAAEAILVGAALPLVIRVAVSALHDVLTRKLWTDGPTLETALTDAGIVAGGEVVETLPNVFEMLAGFAAGAAGQLDLAIGTLNLSLVAESGRVGLGLTGYQAIGIGDLELQILFGAPSAWGAAAAEGLEILLLDIGGDSVDFNFGLRLHGVGIGLSKGDGSALVAESFLRLGSVRALLFLDLETAAGFQILHGGAGLELGGFGLPIGAALDAGGGSNPVASNLLSSGGTSGDSQSVNPSADLDIWYWDHPDNTGGPLRVLVGGQAGIFWIPIHAGFGPIFIAEIGLGVTNTAISLAIDGGVTIAGLSAEVDDLTVTIPYAHVTDPTQWSLDLKGLAIGYSGPAISIAGGLVKFDGPPIEYDGMLLIKIGTIGAVVIGSYSVVGSGADEYTSFAIYGGVFVPIGLTPLINLTGIAIGLGYNRRLIVPEDLNQIPDFMLVKALDRPEALANNPMQALFEFRQQTPPARGALWLAAGIRGTSFELVNITAVLYVALDSGVDVGLIGVARMALPSDDFAIVSIELALKARFSTSEGLFSVQAQLTDNSWLITPDCQLTGGFAFFMWFRKSQFLLTVGGYHPAFKPLPEYPVVPRVGFRWDFLGVVHIKGESYFALTNTAVMTGVRMEATYGPDWIQVWFSAYTDILISWDPFHYIVDVGISVGARLRIRICFFACCTIEISVSVGAKLHLEGPPFHGTVTADLGVTSVTVPFGDDAQALPPAKHWDEFVDTYVRSGDPNSASVSAQVSTGLLPAEPAGAAVAPGTAEQPWRLAAEWSFRTETRMAARGFALQLDSDVAEGQMSTVIFGRYADLAATYDFDLAPMYKSSDKITALHRVVLAKKPENSTSFVDLIPRSQNPADESLEIDERLFRLTPIIGQFSEATYHYFPDLKPPAASNTLPALTGIIVEGVAGLHNASDVIPIGKLVDASNFRPLPFARRDAGHITAVLQAGAAWLELAQVASGVSTGTLLTGLGTIVGSVAAGGAVEFADLRKDSGLRQNGYGPVALNALVTRRSAPPVLSALSEGFTLEDQGAGVAPPPIRVGDVKPVFLEKPRLRSMVQRQAVVAGQQTVARSTVPLGRQLGLADLPVVDVRNDLITSYDAPGFALLTKPLSGTPQPTRAARSARTLRTPDLGAPTGRTVAASMAELAEQVRKDGVTIRAGSTQVWEVPRALDWYLEIAGDSAVRITELSTAGTVLVDREAAGKLQLKLSDGCAMVAVTALGRLPDNLIKNLADATQASMITASVATAGALPVLGWQLGAELVQVGPTTLLARGSVVSLSKPIGASIRGHAAATGMITVSRALLAQEVVQTDFGPFVSVIGVLIDNPDATRLGPESVILNTEQVRVSSQPIQVTAGTRTLFLYDVRRRPSDAGDPDRISVTVGLLTPPGATAPIVLSGVVGGTGTAANWATTLNGSTLTEVVGAEQLTVDGSVSVRLSNG
ncbi:DUF6603 domain-containing protein [Kribbella ginsengisoli]|uniref:DUF6603 domain-containing protein n=1 Tax=Kribbella ginsengisoli TaxID=363865 RepID=A0ABP6YNQ3_9ACTN